MREIPLSFKFFWNFISTIIFYILNNNFVCSLIAHLYVEFCSFMVSANFLICGFIIFEVFFFLMPLFLHFCFVYGLFVLISFLLEALLIYLVILDTLEILRRQALKSWLEDGCTGSLSYGLHCRIIGQQNHIFFEELKISVCFLKLFCFSRDRFSTLLLEGG